MPLGPDGGQHFNADIGFTGSPAMRGRPVSAQSFANAYYPAYFPVYLLPPNREFLRMPFEAQKPLKITKNMG